MKFASLAASPWLVLLLVLGACAQDDDSGFEAAVEADRQLAACLEAAGYHDPFENAHVRRLEDPQFNDDVEACAEQLGIKIPPLDQLVELPGDTNRR